ncbi:hypothetical protein GCM10008097_24320 [Mycetocola manganoxydans]|nr:hypothetical protein GCM10008097_24320 [Mycetocola manganoxydans]
MFTCGMESNEAPDETGDGAGPELPLPALVAETCSAMLDAVAIIDRIEAKQDAWKIEFLDQARRIAETTEHGVLTVGSKLTEVQRREMVRRSFVAEVAAVLRIPEVTAGRLIDDSEILMHRLPSTYAALREGDISLRHARTIVDQIATLSDNHALELEEAALGYAKKLTVSKFSQKVRVLRERIDADSITERRVKSAQDRRVEFVPARDGMAWLNLYTTAPEAASLYTAIRDTAITLQSRIQTRTLTQLGADVCADALATGLVNGMHASGPAKWKAQVTPRPGSDATGQRAATASSRISPTVLVTVPAMTLLGKSDEPGDLAGYGPIDPDTARKLAGSSTTWFRLLTDPDTGAPLSLGRTRYQPTKRMRAYLELRDGTCRWQGCNRQAKHCDIDHTVSWDHGGPTECENLSHLCPKHHRVKHETTWHPRQLGGGVIEWTSPDGRTYVTEPEVALPPPPEPGYSPEAPEAPEAPEPELESGEPPPRFEPPPVDDGSPPF